MSQPWSPQEYTCSKTSCTSNAVTRLSCGPPSQAEPTERHSPPPFPRLHCWVEGGRLRLHSCHHSLIDTPAESGKFELNWIELNWESARVGPSIRLPPYELGMEAQRRMSPASSEAAHVHVRQSRTHIGHRESTRPGCGAKTWQAPDEPQKDDP